MLAGAGPPQRQGAMRGPAKGGREAELDNVLANVLNDMLSPMDPARHRQGGPRGPRMVGMPQVTEEIV